MDQHPLPDAGLGRDHPRLIAARLIAAAAVLVVTISPLQRWYFEGGFLLGSDATTLLALVAVIVLCNGDATRLGLRGTPDGGWWRWCRIGLWIGLAIGVLAAGYFAILWMLKIPLPVPRTDPRHWLGSMVFMCIHAPIVEEVAYRSLLTFAVQPTLGDTATITVSGIVFAAAHVAGGVASPENQIAGFLLAWAFLRSGTILVPLLWHSAGNLVALGSQMASWHLLPEQWP